jgi:hypothetical protein
MAKLPKDWERRLVELAAVHGVSDFLLGGRLTNIEKKAFFGILGKLGTGARRATPSLARFAGRSAFGLARTAGMVAMKHPVLTAGAIIWVNRDEAAELLREGYDVVSTSDPFGDAAEIMERTRGERVMPPLDPFMRPRGAGAGVKRGKTMFNKSISAGMKAVKKSTKGGKRGRLTNPKRTFATVTKTASKILKGRKVSNRGVTGVAARAMRKILKGSI